ncbi:MAG TPA: branched-chain amino acid ABC transporter substrate-binding protein [Cyanobacteria bacterium UBA11372]|nr:branched-chain amino acid ABC transporter substrate-binding protein [Cyanobacteria bacterium UBA11372]
MVGPINHNPYIIGVPITEPNNFFGRDSLFGFINYNLMQNVKFILLHGQRRIGKSSFLKQIPNFVGNNEFVFVPFDLQCHAQSTLSSILHDLAQEIVQHLQLEDTVQLPDCTALQAEPDLFYRDFLPSVYQAIGDRNLVLLLDEFDVVSNGNPDINIAEQGDSFFTYLSGLLRQQDRLFIITVVGRYVGDMQNLLRLFGRPPHREISFLDDTSTQLLIENPAQGILTYEEDAIRKIWELSGGHPYFTQVICFAIFGQARDLDNWTVTRANVESIVDRAIESAEGGLAWFWDGLSIPEKAIFSAVAEAQEIAIRDKEDVPENPLNILEEYGVIPTDSLEDARNQLAQKGWLDNTRRRVKVELVRRWLVKKHELQKEIKELENLDQKNVNPLRQEADTLQQQGKTQDALAVQFSRILEIDPGRESAQPRLTVQRQRGLIGLIAAALAATAVSFGVYRVATPCPAGEQKALLGIRCEADTRRISRGDRTFFPNNQNRDRDRGIAAFKQGNYSQAAQFFKLAVEGNRNDPELLIYYNNALAKQQGSPITLAAVVPVDNREGIAQEILRGVAQAQNQFNQKKGLNGRLLEIAIANDGNEPEKAKQIAQALVQDQSVLGVIGHYSSDATKPALNEYKKAELPIISPTSTSIFLQDDNFFRTVPSDAAAGKKLAEYARKSLNLNSVAIFYNPDSPYSDSLREEFTKNFERVGGSVVRKIDLTESKFDPEKAVAKSLWKYKAQAIVLFPDSQNTDVALKIATANAQQTARLKTSSQNPQRQGLKLLGGDTLYSQTTLAQGGQYLEGLILAVSFFREAPQLQNFARAAAKQWGGEISWRTASSYDATQAFIKALSPNPTRATVLRKLENTNLSASETSGYSLKFTPQGERQIQPNLVKVEGGKFKLVE